MTVDTARNATLADLATILTDQQGRKLDVVVPARALRSEGGVLVVSGTEAILDESGVTPGDGSYRPTVVCDEGISEKLGIPVAYVKRMRAERPDLFDANVNGWLHGTPEVREPIESEGQWATVPVRDAVPGDPRSFMLRCFRTDDEGEGVARALLSDRFRTIDNLDVLTAALEGVRASGVRIDVAGCDLTDRRMYVRITAPEVQALAPTLLARYRSPFSGASGADNPVVFAGFEISNSETGGGAFTIVPRLVVQVCTNGMTITKDALREVHLGGQLDEGVIRWSEDTQQKSLSLVSARTKDAVATFLDVTYMQRVLDRLEMDAARPLTDPAATIRVIGNQLKFTQERTAGVLDFFIKGSDPTVGGVLHAVTALAQTLPDADDAAELEGLGMRAFELAAASR